MFQTRMKWSSPVVASSGPPGCMQTAVTTGGLKRPSASFSSFSSGGMIRLGQRGIVDLSAGRGRHRRQRKQRQRGSESKVKNPHRVTLCKRGKITAAGTPRADRGKGAAVVIRCYRRIRRNRHTRSGEMPVGAASRVEAGGSLPAGGFTKRRGAKEDTVGESANAKPKKRAAAALCRRGSRVSTATPSRQRSELEYSRWNSSFLDLCLPSNLTTTSRLPSASPLTSIFWPWSSCW